MTYSRDAKNGVRERAELWTPPTSLSRNKEAAENTSKYSLQTIQHAQVTKDDFTTAKLAHVES